MGPRLRADGAVLARRGDVADAVALVLELLGAVVVVRPAVLLAGVGGFQYLKHLPVDYVKIDGEFTRSLPTSPADHEIVSAIVAAAAGLGRTVIAECVEDEEILDALRAFGIPLMQGIHVGRPAPASDLLAALA